MYCSNCGIRLPKGAFSCDSCGKRVGREEKNIYEIKDKKIRLTVKPEFKFLLVIFRMLPISLFLTLWGALFFGGLSVALFKMLEIKVFLPLPFLMSGGIFFLLSLLYPFLTKKVYQNTQYDFYIDRVEFTEKLKSTEKVSLRYPNIEEISYSQGRLQSKFNLGTLLLKVPDYMVHKGIQRGGVYMHDIENPQEIFQKIKKIISKGS